ncbi:MAG: polysaccharide deacetylase family protein [Bacilli bacterium]
MENKKRKKLIVGLLILIMFIFLTSLFLIINKDSKMVNLKDKTISEIKKYAKAEDLILEIKEEYHKKILKGKVISQNVLPGTVLEKKQKLIITISLGKMDKLYYEKNKVNELGNIPIMMYHGIQNLKNDDTAYIGGNVDRDGYQRTVEAFKNDLEFYYQKDYRMIRLNDYVNGIIDVEVGKSPIVLSFDDGLKNNIRVTGLDEKENIIIDPNSAVGVLETFKKKYPDFNVTATFFLNGGLFEQPEYNKKILNWLIDNGYDIGNHSYGHANLTNIGTAETEKEIGRLYNLLKDKIKDKYIKIVALPFGSPYETIHPNFKHILSGNYEGKKYETIATLRVGWESEYSPFNKNFDQTFLKRIRAYDNLGTEFDIEHNFKMLEKTRYISDGDKETIVIPKEKKDKLQEKTFLEVITY